MMHQKKRFGLMKTIYKVNKNERKQKENGSYMCKDLLGCDLSTEEGVAEAVEKKLFTEFCPKMVMSAVQIVEKILYE